VKLQAIWTFIAGDAKRAPAAVAAAVALVVAAHHWAPAAGAWIGVLFVGTIAAGLVASVFE
jgi:hypothetical protein